MHYFSGFSLQNESELFDFWLQKDRYSVAGFSYGAIKALEYICSTDKRVDRLLLLSPAFFNNKSEAFKKTQLIYFKKDSKAYRENFIKNMSEGCEISLNKYIDENATVDELKELLYYEWSNEKLKFVIDKGVTIEVVLGCKDKIIDANEAKNFFQEFATVYCVKEANHLLRLPFKEKSW